MPPIVTYLFAFRHPRIDCGISSWPSGACLPSLISLPSNSTSRSKFHNGETDLPRKTPPCVDDFCTAGPAPFLSSLPCPGCPQPRSRDVLALVFCRSLTMPMTRRHAASLLPKWHHDPALLKLVRSPLTNAMVCEYQYLGQLPRKPGLTNLSSPPLKTAHITEKAIQVIRCRPESSSQLPSPPTTPIKEGFDASLPSLESFIKSIVRKSKCHVPTLLVTLVYLDRLKLRLPARSSGSPSTRYRVFLATLIVASKYCNGQLRSSRFPLSTG
jgi:hypothetical protein